MPKYNNIFLLLSYIIKDVYIQLLLVSLFLYSKSIYVGACYFAVSRILGNLYFILTS